MLAHNGKICMFLAMERPTEQKANGKKKTLTKVRSLTF